MYSPFHHISSVLWKHKPVHLTVFLTRRCNQKCPFCFYLSSEIETDKAELTLDEIKRISSSIGRLLWLAFSGGEIFLRKDLVEITRAFYEKNKPAIILFPTNGILTEIIKEKIEAILTYCEKSIIVVKLSLDGTEYVHDSIRGKGSFQKTMQTYDALGGLLEKYPNFELGVNTVFCSENQDTMDSIINFVNSLTNIKTHTISLIRGELSNEHFKKIDYDKYNRAIQKLEENLKNKVSNVYRFKGARIKAAQDILQRRLIHKTMLEGKRQVPCYAGRLNLVLTETGDVYPCEILKECFGNVRDYDYNIERVIHSDNAKRIIDSIKKNKCYCTHECYLMTNILFNARMYPELAKEYLQLKLH